MELIPALLKRGRLFPTTPTSH